MAEHLAPPRNWTWRAFIAFPPICSGSFGNLTWSNELILTTTPFSGNALFEYIEYKGLYSFIEM